MAMKKTAAKKRQPAKKPMVVIASGERALEDVAKDLKTAGFEVGDVLHAIGQVTGNAAPSLKTKLKRIRGVAEVTDTHEDINIGPPEAPVQ